MKEASGSVEEDSVNKAQTPNGEASYVSDKNSDPVNEGSTNNFVEDYQRFPLNVLKISKECPEFVNMAIDLTCHVLNSYQYIHYLQIMCEKIEFLLTFKKKLNTLRHFYSHINTFLELFFSVDKNTSESEKFLSLLQMIKDIKNYFRFDEGGFSCISFLRPDGFKRQLESLKKELESIYKLVNKEEFIKYVGGQESCVLNLQIKPSSWVFNFDGLPSSEIVKPVIFKVYSLIDYLVEKKCLTEMPTNIEFKSEFPIPNIHLQIRDILSYLQIIQRSNRSVLYNSLCKLIFDFPCENDSFEIYLTVLRENFQSELDRVEDIPQNVLESVKVIHMLSMFLLYFDFIQICHYSISSRLVYTRSIATILLEGSDDLNLTFSSDINDPVISEKILSIKKKTLVDRTDKYQKSVKIIRNYMFKVISDFIDGKFSDTNMLELLFSVETGSGSIILNVQPVLDYEEFNESVEEYKKESDINGIGSLANAFFNSSTHESSFSFNPPLYDQEIENMCLENLISTGIYLDQYNTFASILQKSVSDAFSSYGYSAFQYSYICDEILMGNLSDESLKRLIIEASKLNKAESIRQCVISIISVWRYLLINKKKKLREFNMYSFMISTANKVIFLANSTNENKLLSKESIKLFSIAHRGDTISFIYQYSSVVSLMRRSTDEQIYKHILSLITSEVAKEKFEDLKDQNVVNSSSFLNQLQEIYNIEKEDNQSQHASRLLVQLNILVLWRSIFSDCSSFTSFIQSNSYHIKIKRIAAVTDTFNKSFRYDISIPLHFAFDDECPIFSNHVAKLVCRKAVEQIEDFKALEEIKLPDIDLESDDLLSLEAQNLAGEFLLEQLRRKEDLLANASGTKSEKSQELNKLISTIVNQRKETAKLTSTLNQLCSRWHHQKLKLKETVEDQRNICEEKRLQHKKRVKDFENMIESLQQPNAKQKDLSKLISFVKLVDTLQAPLYNLNEKGGSYEERMRVIKDNRKLIRLPILKQSRYIRKNMEDYDDSYDESKPMKIPLPEIGVSTYDHDSDDATLPPRNINILTRHMVVEESDPTYSLPENLTKVIGCDYDPGVSVIKSATNKANKISNKAKQDQLLRYLKSMNKADVHSSIKSFIDLSSFEVLNTDFTDNICELSDMVFTKSSSKF